MKYMLTDAGLNLQGKIQSGTGAVLQLTRAAGGAGYSNNPAELTELINPKQSIQVENVTVAGNTATVELILSNIGMEEEYILMQIGLYAQDPETGEEILYIVGQDVRGERIPAIADLQVEYKFNVSMQISNASTIIFDIQAGDFLNKKTFHEFLAEEFRPHVHNTENPHGVTLAQLDAAAAGHKHTAEDVTSGTMSIARGGTGATDATTARANLGAAASGHKHAAVDVTSGTLPIARGGTGATTTVAARTNLELRSAAMCGVANNLTTTESWYLLDARQGKALKDNVDQINSDLGGLSFKEDENGAKWVRGADTVWVRLGNEYYSDFASSVNSSAETSKQYVVTYDGTLIAFAIHTGGRVYINDILILSGHMHNCRAIMDISVGDKITYTAPACPGSISFAAIVVVSN